MSEFIPSRDAKINGTEQFFMPEGVTLPNAYQVAETVFGQHKHALVVYADSTDALPREDDFKAEDEANGGVHAANAHKVTAVRAYHRNEVTGTTFYRHELKVVHCHVRVNNKGNLVIRPVDERTHLLSSRDKAYSLTRTAAALAMAEILHRHQLSTAPVNDEVDSINLIGAPAA